MALLSDDGDFYVRAGITWLLSANLAVAILLGWIQGYGFRSKLFHFAVLVYGMLLGRDGLKLRRFLANLLEESRRFRCPGPVGVPCARECFLIEGAYIQDLERVATSSFHVMVIVVLVIWGKRGPPRPRVGGLGGAGTIFIEVLLFAVCVLTCVRSLPVLILDYMTAAANRGDAAVA